MYQYEVRFNARLLAVVEQTMKIDADLRYFDRAAKAVQAGRVMPAGFYSQEQADFYAAHINSIDPSLVNNMEGID